jgi:protein involved in sex pheromone biosynthesis
MTRPTLATIQTKLENIEQEIKDLKLEKVGTDVWVIQHQQLKDDIKDVKAEIAIWRFYARWAVLIVAGIIITAVMGLIIK